MRALGPQSVSSFLKTALDVVSGGTFLLAAFCAPAGAALLIYMPLAGASPPALFGLRITLSLGALAAFLLTLAIYLGILHFVLVRLRRVAGTLMMGDPFQPENVGRLRLIGAGLIGLELAAMPLRAAVNWLSPGKAGDVVSLHPTAWFAILVVFVLAEVFREGARLRREAELTI